MIYQEKNNFIFVFLVGRNINLPHGTSYLLMYHHSILKPMPNFSQNQQLDKFTQRIDYIYLLQSLILFLVYAALGSCNAAKNSTFCNHEYFSSPQEQHFSSLILFGFMQFFFLLLNP